MAAAPSTSTIRSSRRGRVLSARSIARHPALDLTDWTPADAWLCDWCANVRMMASACDLATLLSRTIELYPYETVRQLVERDADLTARAARLHGRCRRPAEQLLRAVIAQLHTAVHVGTLDGWRPSGPAGAWCAAVTARAAAGVPLSVLLDEAARRPDTSVAELVDSNWTLRRRCATYTALGCARAPRVTLQDATRFAHTRAVDPGRQGR